MTLRDWFSPLSVALFIAPGLIFAATIPVASTGDSVSSGKDMNYSIVSDATKEGVPGPAFIVTGFPPNNTKAGPDSGWATIPGGSQWIAPMANQVQSAHPGTCCYGMTVYRTTFSMKGLEPSTANLSITMLADDWTDVYLNDIHVYAPPAQMFAVPVLVQVKAGIGPCAAGAPNSTPPACFLPDNNVLEFRVNNAGSGPTGLNASVSGTADPVQSGPPALDLSPISTWLTAPKGGSFAQAETLPIWIRNSGSGGAQPLQIGVAETPQCHTIGGLGFFALNSPTATNQLAPAFTLRNFATNPANATVNPGFYRANLHFTSGSLAQDLCMNFLLTDGPVPFSVSKTGLTFNAQAKVGSQRTQTVPVFAGAGRVDWTYTTISQSDFLNVSAPSSSSTAGNGTVTGSLSVGVKPMTDPGTYYGLIVITPKTQGLQPALVTVVYNVTADSPAPDLSAAGLIFTVTPGANTPAQSFSLLPSTSGSQPYTLKSVGAFLTLATPAGSLGGTGTTPVPVSLNTALLRQGLNRGSVQVGLPNGVTKTIDVAAILLPPVVTTGTTPTVCAPSQIAVVGTSVAGGFSQSVGSPVAYQARVVDDCGNLMTNAKVELSFSNGDPAVTAALEDSKTATYTATWNPLQAGAATITARATAGSLSASTTTAGTVLASNAPVITPHGSLHNFNPQAGAGAALAPGSMASITGTGLAATSDMFSQMPLATTMDGTKVTIAGIDVPIFSIDSGKITVLIPTELASNTAYQVVVSNNGAVSASDTILIADVAPGLATNPDGTVVAQHLDTTPVTTDNPAAPGETIYLFGSGFGVTDQAVATNTLAPTVEPLARPVNPVTMTVDGNSTDVDTVLAPGGIGLYRLQITVAQDANPGNLTVVVSQKNLKANQGMLPVAVPAAQ